MHSDLFAIIIYYLFTPSKTENGKGEVRKHRKCRNYRNHQRRSTENQENESNKTHETTIYLNGIS